MVLSCITLFYNRDVVILQKKNYTPHVLIRIQFNVFLSFHAIALLQPVSTYTTHPSYGLTRNTYHKTMTLTSQPRLA